MGGLDEIVGEDPSISTLNRFDLGQVSESLC